ncbi:hypothetical protein AXF42_Ash018874 [Apostasia shenzhenica]|uniref:Uncharacterized protein n=1 Tax=Apostasia shenzhenica TaxID=1088818 RepID=A0A2I0B506_9ASPA|nr:hypothetical protein AXF42_Ash018874 [Apostasia shenzhenica]
MGQAVPKPKSGEQVELQDEENVELKKLIQGYLDDNFTNIEGTIKNLDDFYHVIYEIVEQLSVRRGAVQFRIPTIDMLKKEVDAVLEKRVGLLSSKNFPLTKKEVKEVIQRVVSIERLHIGRGARDLFLYIFGIPVVGLLAKRIIPGPTSSIPDELLIPIVTSGTVIVLAKTNRI